MDEGKINNILRKGRITNSDINELTLHEAALLYRRIGLNVVPCAPASKEVCLPFIEHLYVEARAVLCRRPKLEVVDRWYQRWPAANIAHFLGVGMIVLDMHEPERCEAFMKDRGIHLPAGAPRVRTPSGGVHVYLGVSLHQGWETQGDFLTNLLFRPFSNFIPMVPPCPDDRIIPGLHIYLGQELHFLLPPSSYNGKRYEFVGEFTLPIPPVPAELLRHCWDLSDWKISEIINDEFVLGKGEHGRRKDIIGDPPQWLK